MKVSIIVAMAQDRVIGKANRLPWHIPEDLKRFKAITMGHPIIMGRKTFESIGRPLPGRHNIVVSRNRSYKAEGTTVVKSLKEALKIFYNEGRGKEEIFIIGGAALFAEAIPFTDRIYLTMIDHPFPGDVFFPDVDWEKEFKVVEKSEPLKEKEKGFPYHFLVADRVVPKSSLNLSA